MTYKSVVVGTDGSATAEVAVRNAATLAATDGARLVVVTAFRAHASALGVSHGEEPPEELRWVVADRAQAEARAGHGRTIAKEVGLSRVTVQAIEGDPAEVLLKAATDFDADLIVVGSRGLTSATRFVLGSVAGTVAHHAPCDVLIVHTTG